MKREQDKRRVSLAKKAGTEEAGPTLKSKKYPHHYRKTIREQHKLER
jgi:hypothetical protein